MATGTTTSATPANKKTVKTASAAPAKNKTVVTAASRQPRGNVTGKSRRVNPDQRRNYIEVAAYYIAERRGFSGGHETEDWATAEIEIDRLLAEGKLNG